MKAIASIALLIALALLPAACRKTDSPAHAPEIAATNSYLACAVRDLCGDDTEVLCLAPPGTCPGHFDISPASVAALARCRLLLLFDFQAGLENSLSRLTDNGLRTVLVELPPALCVPNTYALACSQVCDVLCDQYPEKAPALRKRLREIQNRMDALADDILADVTDAGARSAPVLVSVRQSRFAAWLGLDVVDTFLAVDLETPGSIDRCITRAAGRDVRFVIANRQEGTALTDALAERLDAEPVVFSNFPAEDFDSLVTANVRNLLEAAAK